jgi:hypothetical protein
MLVPVLSEHVEAAWPLAEPFIRAACRRGPLPCDAEDLREACEQGRHQLWICERDNEQVAAAVTGILADDRACVWIAMGGDFGAAEPAIPQIEEWARDHGCSSMRSFSRVGMVKRFPPEYRTRGVILERKL